MCHLLSIKYGPYLGIILSLHLIQYPKQPNEESIFISTNEETEPEGTDLLPDPPVTGSCLCSEWFHCVRPKLLCFIYLSHIQSDRI